MNFTNYERLLLAYIEDQPVLTLRRVENLLLRKRISKQKFDYFYSVFEEVTQK